MAGKAVFLVRSVVADESLRERFDQWYSTEHLPLAISTLGADKGWRAWSKTDPSVHYAAYHFDSMEKLEASLASDGFKAIVADYDKTWPQGVTRSREVLHFAEEVLG